MNLMPKCKVKNALWLIVAICSLQLATALGGIQPARAEWNLLDGVLLHPQYRGSIPKKSDVIFSARFKRVNAIEMIKNFGATRVEWVYTDDPIFIGDIKAVTNWFGGTVNAVLPLPTKEGLVLDFDGNPIVPFWMSSWGAKSITATSPHARRALEDAAKFYLDSGADTLQFDDPLLQLGPAEWGGGDFSPSTLDEFNKFLARYPDQDELQKLGITSTPNFNYRDYVQKTFGIKNTQEYKSRYNSLPTTPIWRKFLKESVLSYFVRFREFLNAKSGRRFILSMNLSELSRPNERNPHFMFWPYLDYSMSETPIEDWRNLYITAATHRALGIGYVPSIRPKEVTENRLAIASLYALGTNPLVPWDVYVYRGPNNKPERYFGTIENYGDLFHFVRNHPTLFDGFESASVVGLVVPVDHYREKETLALINRMLKYNIPFSFVLTGGVVNIIHIDVEKAKKYKVLLSVNPKGNFSRTDLPILESIGMIDGNEMSLSDEALQRFSPFTVDELSEPVSYLPRSSDDRARLVIHIIDRASKDVRKKAKFCRKKLGLKSSFLGGMKVRTATLYAPEAKLTVPVIQNSWGSEMTIDSCFDWSVLSMEISQVSPDFSRSLVNSLTRNLIHNYV